MTSEATEDPEVVVEIEVASKTDVGQVRTANEDSCDLFERSDGTRLLIVADGMGGHQGGATASQTAVATISDLFLHDASNQIEALIHDAITTANKRIFAMAQSDPGLEGMGTTVVAFLLDSNRRGTVAHVGDSRAYRYRQGRLEALTVDHSVVAEMHRRGLISTDEAAVHPRRNEILRSVGVLAEVEVEVAEVEVAPGDRFLLCSDGLTGVLSDEEIAAVVQVESPENAVEQLVQMANDRGGPDNITVQLLSIPPDREDGDPEATAPVELSEVGIQAIETRRKDRKRARSIAIGLIAAGIGLCLYIAWLTLWPSTETNPTGTDRSSAMPDRREPSAPSMVDDSVGDAVGDEVESHRRGIPR
jgi:serine/threonine protein phosphatase PrpC